jgi:methionyl aminopeptidase
VAVSVPKTAAEIDLMRQAGRIVSRCLQKLQEAAQPGISGEELDAIAESVIRSMGGKPSFKGYGGFPATICLSVNDEVAHGIPSPRRLKTGDLVSIDVGAIWSGYQGDAAISFCVGSPSPQAQRLLAVTKAALYLGIEAARPGKRVVDIARAIQAHVEKNGYSIVRDLVGHGIGRQMHEPPQIPHYVTGGASPLLRAGMTVAIEPMVNIGDWRIRREADGWTYRTTDGSLSAHFEHTIAITEKGPVILTREEGGETDLGAGVSLSLGQEAKG